MRDLVTSPCGARGSRLNSTLNNRKLQVALVLKYLEVACVKRVSMVRKRESITHVLDRSGVYKVGMVRMCINTLTNFRMYVSLKWKRSNGPEIVA